VAELKRDFETAGDQKSAAQGWLGKLAMSGATAAVGSLVPVAAKAIAAYFGVSIP